MRVHQVAVSLSGLFSFVLLSSCGSGGSDLGDGGGTLNQVPEFVTLDIDVSENQLMVSPAIANDADADALSFSIVGGADAALFSIDATTGATSFLVAPDFENPQDANVDNVYQLDVEVSDGTDTVSAMVNVTVTDESLLEVRITFPSPATDNKARSPDMFVVGRLSDVEDGVVQAGDINFLDVNGTLVTPDPADPTRWHAKVAAPSGVSTLTVTVESASGQQHQVSQDLRNQFVLDTPGAIAMDSVNERAFLWDDGLNAIVEINTVTGARNIFSSPVTTYRRGDGPSFGNVEGLSLDADNNRLLVANSGVFEEDVQIFLPGHFLAVDLTTGDRSYLSSSSAAIGSGSAGTNVAMDIIADPLNDRALALAYDGATFSFSSCPGNTCLLTTSQDILDIGEFSGDRSVFADDLTSNAMRLAMDYTNDRVWVLNAGSTREVNTVSLTTRLESELSAPSVPDNDNRFSEPNDIAVNADGSKGYVTDPRGHVNSSFTRVPSVTVVDGIDGARSILTSEEHGSGIDLDEPVGITLDEANDRALVSDAALPAVVDVSLTTGDRSVLSGSVAQIKYPSDVEADPANHRVFIGTATQNTVFVVDLVTGALDVVSGPGASGPVLGTANGMGLDSANDRLYVLDGGALVSIDLASGDRTVISGYNNVTMLDVGSGPEMYGLQDMALDLANNRALVLEQGNIRLLSVNLTTGERIILSDNVSEGTGDAFDQPFSMAVNLAGGKAYVGDAGDSGTGFGFILEVDLVTGDRSIIADNNGIGSGNSLNFISDVPLAWDSVNDRLIYMPGSPYIVDILTGDRTSISQEAGYTPIELGPQSAGGPEGVSFDPVNELLYQAERNYSGVFEYDLSIAARGVIAQ